MGIGVGVVGGVGSGWQPITRPDTRPIIRITVIIEVSVFIYENRNPGRRHCQHRMVTMNILGDINFFDYKI